VLAFLAGVAFGVFGAGGSILLVPILVYVLHLPVKVSLGMALLILVLTGVLAAQAHARSGNTDWKIGLQWSALGIFGAYLGGRVAGYIPPLVLISIFALVIIVSAVAMLRPGEKQGAQSRPEPLPLWKTGAVGLSLGFFTGVIGVGGGFLLVPALVLFCGVDVKKAIGTSLIIISVNSLGGFLGFSTHTSFPIALTATIAIFNAAGSLVGERISKPLPAHRLRPAFAVFLLALGTVLVIRNVIDIFSGHPL
jgi:uncharacterized membrane protein YfcA